MTLSNKPTSDEQPGVWINVVVPEGSSEPVPVILDGRDGNKLYLRQADPRDKVDPILFDPAQEELILMQVVSHVGIHVTPEVVGRMILLPLCELFLSGAKALLCMQGPCGREKRIQGLVCIFVRVTHLLSNQAVLRLSLKLLTLRLKRAPMAMPSNEFALDLACHWTEARR
jgi:hypothetical protein